MQYPNHKKLQLIPFIFFSSSCEKQHCNELLWCCRDALAFKSCSPDVRKHVTDSNQCHNQCYRSNSETLDFFLLRYWLTHGQNMSKKKQSSLLTNFGFTSEKLNQGNPTFMLVHRLTDLIFVRLQRNTGALVWGRPPDCHGIFRTLFPDNGFTKCF